MKRSRHNDQIYNLALCDEGKKVKLFLQFDIDGDGDPDVVVTFLPKKLGGDVEGDIIEKLRKFFDVFGFPKVLIVLSSLDVDKVRWVKGFPEIKRIDIMPPVKKTEVEPVETWYFTMKALHKKLFLVLRDSKKILLRRKLNLPVPSVEAEIKEFLWLAFQNNEYPGKIINETPDRFSFTSDLFDSTWFEQLVIDVIPVDDKEHLLIMVK